MFLSRKLDHHEDAENNENSLNLSYYSLGMHPLGMIELNFVIVPKHIVNQIYQTS